MTLVIALDASSRTYAVAVGAGIQPAAKRSSRRDDPDFAGIGELTAWTLADAGAAFSDIAAIGVDVGPGGLSSVRAAVAYANGLAFSLGVQIFAVSSLELMAIAVQREHHGPVLCVKRGQGGNVYGALFIGGENTEMYHGMPDAVIPALVGGLGEISVAGTTRDEISGLAPGVTVLDTGIMDADVTVLYQGTRDALAHPERLVGITTPLNEASRIFHRPSSRR